MFEEDEYTYEDALALVSRESPAASDKERIYLAKKLLRLMEKHNDTAERIWMISKYWE